MKIVNGLSRRAVLSAAPGAASYAAAPHLFAQQQFPARPINFLVGYPAGGIADIVARAASTVAEKRLGQPIVIQNRPGAAGVNSFVALKNAPPDGYTIAMATAALWRQPIVEDVDYDPLKDFTYILNLFDNTFAVMVAADSPFKTWADLLAWGRANMTKVSYASIPGLGQSPHIFMEEVSAQEKLKWQAVPFPGTPPGVTAVIGGHVTFGMMPVLGTNTLVKSGKVRYLAVASDERLKGFPQVPTMRELGYSARIDSPSGIAGPAGMSPAVVKTLHDAYKFALDDPSVIAILENADQHVRYAGSDDYRKMVMSSMTTQRELLTRYGFAKKR